MQNRYDFKLNEKEMQEFWDREQIYKFDPDGKGELYSIDTPPPTVSGSLHIGHIFSFAQAEMIARYKRMQGYNVFYPFGFDDNGLPTERLVERDEKIRAADLKRSEFIEKCDGVREKYENEFIDMWKSLGFSTDWSMRYTTISPEVRKISQSLFIELAKTGKAYMKESPVLWCTECRTSIAQAELDTKDSEGSFIYIPFTAGDEILEVATTRPELLWGCVCLFVNPEDGRFTHFIGKNAKVPLYDFEIPILADEKADPEKGTGVVMCATFGDSTDAQWYEEHSLPYKKVILPNGKIDDSVPFIGGMRIKAARAEMIRLLEEKKLLLRTEKLTHTVAVHERCGKEIEIIPSRQWYIDILTEKERFLQAADEINWYPDSMKTRYKAWVSNLKWDWCISRQRYFGVPFPVWYCKSCGKPALANENQLPVNPMETEYHGTCECGCMDFMPETAVFDTWATSSITPQINSRLGLNLSPMSMRTHAHEIIRTWTFYSIVRSLYHTGEIPWKDLMISGFVLAKKGEKISKSKGNSNLTPSRLIEEHSADVLRYWAANSKLGTDTFFSQEDLKIAKRFITKLWNAYRFAAGTLADFDGAAPDKLLPIDRWIIEKTNAAIISCERYLNEYEIGSARHEMDDFFWKDFCDNYLEIVKERLYTDKNTDGKQSAMYALYYSFYSIIKLYAIYTPHITEFIYQDLFSKHEEEKSIHLTKWIKVEAVDERAIAFGNKIEEIVADARRIKSEQNLSMKSEIPELVIDTGDFQTEIMLTLGDLKTCTHAAELIMR